MVGDSVHVGVNKRKTVYMFFICIFAYPLELKKGSYPGCRKHNRNLLQFLGTPLMSTQVHLWLSELPLNVYTLRIQNQIIRIIRDVLGRYLMSYQAGKKNTMAPKLRGRLACVAAAVRGLRHPKMRHPKMESLQRSLAFALKVSTSCVLRCKWIWQPSWAQVWGLWKLRVPHVGQSD